MFKKILVPLDGSTFSKAVLPHVLALAKCSNAQVILLRAIPLPIQPPVMAHSLPVPTPVHLPLDEHAHAEGYLQRVIADDLPSDLDARYEIRVGNTAEAILEYAAGNAVDLIAMTTHGRSGILRLMLGSVAEQIVRRSHLPVLLVRPTEE